MNSFIDIAKKADKPEELYCHICIGTDSPCRRCDATMLIVFKIPGIKSNNNVLVGATTSRF